MFILDNPEFIRLRRAKLRLRVMCMIALAVIAILGGIAGLMYYGIVVADNKPVSKMLGYFFWVATYLLLGVTSLYTMNLSGQNIAQERELNTYDFQRLVSMGPWRLALGKLFGAPIEAWFLLLCGLPFVLVPYTAGEIPAWVTVQVVIVLCLNLIGISSLCLACSSLSEKTARAGGLAFVATFGSAGLISALANWNTGPGTFDPGMANPVACFIRLEQARPNVDYPLIGYLPLTILLFSLFFCVTARRLANEELAPLSTLQAMLFFLGLEILVAYTSLLTNRHPEERFHITSFCMLLMMAFLTMPSSDLLRARAHRANRDDHWKLLREFHSRYEDHSPLPGMLLLALIYIGVSFIFSFGSFTEARWGPDVNGNYVETTTQVPVAQMWDAMLLVAGSGVALSAFLLYLSYYLERGALRLGLIMLIAALAVPPIACAVVQSDNIMYALSPFAYLGTNNWHRRTGACPLIALALAGTFIMLAAMRLRFLLDIRAIELKRIEQERTLPSAPMVAE